MKIFVQKYGGTSVGSTELIRNVAKRIIKLKETQENIVVVVSAMGETTDKLIELANKLASRPNPREYDALISTGENVSAALLSIALNELEQKAISLNGPQAGIATTGPYTKAKIVNVNSERILKELEEGKVVVVTGFQGINDMDDITTIGRGGSDTSAVVLAAASGAEECDICTDVDGVYTTDPRIEPKATKLTEISYDEMLELASLGAKVLHPRAVECAKENNVVIHVRSSFKEDIGTKVKEAGKMEVNKPVTGIALNEEEAILSIIGVPDDPGVAGKLFTRLAEAAINVDMIIQSVEENHANKITFTINGNDMDTAERITHQVSEEIGAGRARRGESIAKVSIVGVGMISKPGIAAKMFQVLGDNNINIQLISTSEIKISCAIDKNDGKKALHVLHQAFELG
ncbi:aspartate kinase [Candidatus Margulisiibacteriota bacterium]